MALPPSTANWHWKNKNVTRWAREWFERELTLIAVKGDKEGEEVAISSVRDVDGDVELGQRKSKLITIYDCKIDLSWTGTASDGTDVEGKLTIPEVSHEITLDGLSDYQFQWSLTTESTPAVEALFTLAKTRLPTALETKLAEFPSALIATHGKDLQVGVDGSRGGTPGPSSGTSTSATSAPAQPAPPAVKKPAVAVNTAEVVVEGNFVAPADDLFSLFTDESRIPAWSRAPAKSNPEPGSEYSLFGGGVKGKYVSLEPSKKIVQTWALSSPSWPSNHAATMTTTFKQSDDSTMVTWTLSGVPTGMEDEIKRNIEGYYVQGLKNIGYVHLVLAQLPPRPRAVEARGGPPRPPPSTKTTKDARRYIAAIAIALLSLVAAVLVPYFSGLKLKLLVP